MMILPIPVFCTLASLGIALLSLVGWVSGIERLTSVQPGLPRMVPMTAMLVLLASAAILRQWRAGRRKAADAGRLSGHPGMLPAAALASAAIAIGLCRALGWMPAPTVPALGMSSPVTATMFGALGVSLLCMLDARWVRRGQWIAIGVLLLGILTAAGYGFRQTILYEMLPGKGTSILTTLALLLLATAVLALRPAEGIMEAVAGPGPGAWFVRRLLGVALAVPVLLGAAAALALHFEVADPGTLIAMVVWSMIVMFTVMVCRLSLRLYRIEGERSAAEAQREAALAALREADVRKDDFLAMLAHELRNPLAPIRAGADLLQRTGGADPQLRRTSEIISRQVDHMVHLVDDLLDVSRVTRGLIAIEQKPVDAHRAVCDAVEQARPAIAQRGHQLHTVLGEQHPLVLGDHKRLVQVVVNLLNNAGKYTPPGGRIEVGMRVGAGEVEIEVRDNGIGIDAGLLPRVFDTFTQATRTAGRAEGGLGLGLALVKRLTELHGGKVAAGSAGLGQGSSFTVTLPRLQDAAAAASVPAPAAAADAAARS